MLNYKYNQNELNFLKGNKSSHLKTKINRTGKSEKKAQKFDCEADKKEKKKKTAK